MSPTLRAAIAAFDAVAMAAFAYVRTGGFGQLVPDLVLWGSAAAAAIAAFVVATDGAPVLGWVAVGYILFAGLLVAEEPQIVLVALAVALMPVLERPRRSLALGIAIATIAAFCWRIGIVLLLRSA